MRFAVDLHSHSGYAGGVGTISLGGVAATMARKGINAFGVGDCLQPDWCGDYRERLIEREPGLFALRSAPAPLAAARFVLQTEIIITSPVASGGRKTTHTVLLFPAHSAVDDALRLMRQWGVKVNMGRPFLKCGSPADVEEKCRALRAIDESVMIIPAHVMTPQGVYGSDRPVDSLADVFGAFARDITTVETGLSADPALLALLPELDGRTLVSNSDCHSGALNRVGREYTVLDVDCPSYAAIVAALRAGRVRYTAEFNPAEGRFFLTGHRSGLVGHAGASCYFSPDTTPADGRCPICGKPLTVGVLERALALSARQAADGRARKLSLVKPKQDVKTMVPLVEVAAAGLGVKSVTAGKVLAVYDALLGGAGTEADVWEMPDVDIPGAFRGKVPEGVLAALLQVKRGEFSFLPGFDGTYGRLRLGERIGWFGHAVVTQ